VCRREFVVGSNMLLKMIIVCLYYIVWILGISVIVNTLCVGYIVWILSISCGWIYGGVSVGLWRVKIVDDRAALVCG